MQAASSACSSALCMQHGAVHPWRPLWTWREHALRLWPAIPAFRLSTAEVGSSYEFGAVCLIQ